MDRLTRSTTEKVDDDGDDDFDDTNDQERTNKPCQESEKLMRTVTMTSTKAREATRSRSVLVEKRDNSIAPKSQQVKHHPVVPVSGSRGQ